MDFQFFQILAVLLGVSGALIAPTIWFYRHNTSRIENDSKSVIEKLEQNNSKAYSAIRTDLKDFRTHFDLQLNEVQRSVDARNREMKDFVSKELEHVRNHITSIELKVDQTRERNHEIEKDLLRLENVIGKDYITKDHLKTYFPRAVRQHGSSSDIN